MRVQLSRTGLVELPTLAVALWLVLAAMPAAARADGVTKLTSDFLIYSDTDSVMVVSPQLGASHAFDEDGSEVTARVVIDAVSAASVDVVSSASYRFSEVRTQLDLAASKAFGTYVPAISYRMSNEPDYDSHGVGLGLQKRLAGADTVLSTSYGLTLDTIGRVDTPSEVFSESLTSHAAEVGITQNINEITLVRAVYTLTAQFGYMEKPYRTVPLFDAAGLAAARADSARLTLDTFDEYRLSVRPPEAVPDNRYRHAVALRGLRYLPSLRSSVRLDYRLYGDSWGVFAHTIEPAVYRALNETWRLNLWSRFHQQSSASFWQREYVVSGPNAVPATRTIDRALTSSWHLTGGARFEWQREPFAFYFELAAMHSSFTDHLLIDSRFALISQGGFRWNL